MSNGKRGRPRKNDNEKSGKVTMTAPVEQLAAAHILGYSNSAMFQLALEYVTTLANYGVVVEGVKRDNPTELKKLVQTLVDYTLVENEKYLEEKKIEAVQKEERDIDAYREFTAELYEFLKKEKRNLRDAKLDAKNNLRWLLDKHPEIDVSYNEVLDFMMKWDNGRMRTELDKPRQDSEIFDFVERLLHTPPIVSTGTFRVVSVEI